MLEELGKFFLVLLVVVEPLMDGIRGAMSG
jgi:hypothetical protein